MGSSAANGAGGAMVMGSGSEVVVKAAAGAAPGLDAVWHPANARLIIPVRSNPRRHSTPYVLLSWNTETSQLSHGCEARLKILERLVEESDSPEAINGTKH